jgi:2-polyprenyl-6-methoxyphenol hydroxylase-like FAD-dependent oxidoreductase
MKPLKSFVNQRILLLGDAAHATTPNMGQGAGQAILPIFLERLITFAVCLTLNLS